MFNEFEQSAPPAPEVKDTAVVRLKSPVKPEDLVRAKVKYEEVTNKSVKGLVKDNIIVKELAESLKEWAKTAEDPTLIESKANWIQSVAKLEESKLIQKSEVQTYLKWANTASAEQLGTESNWLTSVVRLNQKNVIDQNLTRKYVDGILDGKQAANQKSLGQFIVPLGKLVEGKNHDPKYINLNSERAAFLLKSISECSDPYACQLLAQRLKDFVNPELYLSTVAKITHESGPRGDRVKAAAKLSGWIGEKIDAANKTALRHSEDAANDRAYMMTQAFRIFIPPDVIKPENNDKK
jgi:hypothetical protein